MSEPPTDFGYLTIPPAASRIGVAQWTLRRWLDANPRYVARIMNGVRLVRERDLEEIGKLMGNKS